MEAPIGGAEDTPDFVVQDVFNLGEYTDHGVALTIVDAEGARICLHLNISTGELLCERIADALERRYGK